MVIGSRVAKGLGQGPLAFNVFPKFSNKSMSTPHRLDKHWTNC